MTPEQVYGALYKLIKNGTGSTVIHTTNSTQVWTGDTVWEIPLLTNKNVADAYNAVVSGHTAVIADNYDEQHAVAFMVNSLGTEFDAPEISVIWFNRFVVSYEITTNEDEDDAEMIVRSTIGDYVITNVRASDAEIELTIGNATYE